MNSEIGSKVVSATSITTNITTNLICKRTKDPIIITGVDPVGWPRVIVMHPDGTTEDVNAADDLIVISHPVTWTGIQNMKEKIIRKVWSYTPIEHSIDPDINNERLRIRNVLTKAIEAI